MRLKPKAWKCGGCGTEYQTYSKASHTGEFKVRLCGRCCAKGLDQTKRIWSKKR